MSEIDYAALDAADRDQTPKSSPRVRAAVKSTAERVEEAAAALAGRRPGPLPAVFVGGERSETDHKCVAGRVTGASHCQQQQR